MKLTSENIIKTQDKYKPKAILILVDELSQVMNDNNYKLVSSIQNSLGSIARLGRAAGVHLCLATQRPSSNVINADLKNNIQMGCLLGDFDTGASSLIFDEDISDLSKPEIKGRGFIKTGKEINEFQSYWTEKEKHFLLRNGMYMNDTKNNNSEKNIEKNKNKIETNVEEPNNNDNFKSNEDENKLENKETIDFNEYFDTETHNDENKNIVKSYNDNQCTLKLKIVENKSSKQNIKLNFNDVKLKQSEKEHPNKFNIVQ